MREFDGGMTRYEAEIAAYANSRSVDSSDALSKDAFHRNVPRANAKASAAPDQQRGAWS
jgi:hypothetical protein